MMMKLIMLQENDRDGLRLPPITRRANNGVNLREGGRRRGEHDRGIQTQIFLINADFGICAP